MDSLLIKGAKLGSWSSVVGMPVMLEGEGGQVIGQVAVMGLEAPFGMTTRDYYIAVSQLVVDAINERLASRHRHRRT